MFQFLSCYKNLVNFLNFHEFLIKQILKILNYLAETFLSSVFSVCVCKSCCIYAEQFIFSVLIFTAHSFYFCCHNSKIVRFQSELNSVRILFQCVDKLICFVFSIVVDYDTIVKYTEQIISISFLIMKHMLIKTIYYISIKIICYAD